MHALLSFLLLASWAQAQPLNHWPTELSNGVRAKIEKFLEGKNATAALVSVRDFDGKLIYEKTWGKTLDGRETDTHSLFDMASITKVITATLTMEAVQAGELGLADSLSKFFPEYKGPAVVEDLLRHRAGLKPGLNIKYFQNGAQEAVDTIIKSAEAAEVGKFKYSDLGYVLLGRILTQLHHEALDSVYTDFFRRLGMKESCFNGPSCAPLSRNFAGNGVPQEKNSLLSHDPTARALPGLCGNAGLFTTVGDLSRFVQRFVSVERPLLTPALRERMIEMDANGRAIGWDRGSPSTARLRGEILEPKDTIGHTGWTGVSLSVNLSRGYYVIILTNRTQSPNKEDDTGPILHELRLELHKLIHGALAK